MGAAAVLPSLLSLLLVMMAAAAAGAAGAEAAMIRPPPPAGAAGAVAAMIRPAAAAGNKVVGETLCCSNMTGFHECVEACFAFYPREDAEKYCDPGCKAAYLCQTVSGDECPSPSSHHSSPDLLVTITTDSAAAVAEVEVVQAAAETLCCSNMTGFHECLEGCFGFFPPKDADKFCDPGCKEAYQCHTVSGDKCPSEHRSSSSHDSSAKRNAAVDHCILGCNSSVCNKMVTGVGRKGAVKHAVERCNNACYKFCTKQGGVRAGTSTA